jgi:uncharacterized protein
LVFRRQGPLFAETFIVPTRRDIDTRLLMGAAVFGIGWGLSGYCPGPAFASISGITWPLVALLLSMVAGWWLARRI